MKQFIKSGIGEKCPKCFQPMEHRKRISRPKPEKIYYFTEYDFCKPCKHMQHYEKYKNTSWTEQDRQESFFRDLKNEQTN